MLIIGWSFLEGIGAVLIMPAIVALVASNFGKPDRPKAYGLVAAAGAIAAALGPLIGGAFTTYASWRYVFAGEVLIVIVILAPGQAHEGHAGRGGREAGPRGHRPVCGRPGGDRAGPAEVGQWGFVQPKPDAPVWLGLSPVIWMIFAGGAVMTLFLLWEGRRIERGEGALIDPTMLRNLQLRNGVMSFLFMFLIQAGTFFTVPLFLSIALELSAIETGVRLLPMSLTLLLFALAVPKLFPDVSPRQGRRVSVSWRCSPGLVLLVSLLEVGAGPEIITWPLLIAGSGLGALASQLGSVTVSSVPDEMSGQVGGLQNTGTQLGASIGTALAGAMLISALTASFFTGIQNNPDVPESFTSQAQVELSGGVPFMSDTDLEASLQEANVPAATAQEIVDQNAESRIDGLRSALSLLALLALVAIPFTRGLPTVQPGSEAQPAGEPATA